MKRFNHSTKKGFTIIELTLSMAFIGVLLVTIAIISTNVIAIYQKGLSIRSVNSVGKELVDEFSRAVAAAPTKSIASLCYSRYPAGQARNDCVNDNAQKLIFQENHYSGTINLVSDSSIKSADTTVENPPTHGAFCTGRYSYIWNTGYVLNPSYGLTNSAALIRFKNTDNGVTYNIPNDRSDTNNLIRLIRLNDQERTVCANNLNDNSYSLKEDNVYNLGDYHVSSDIADAAISGNWLIYTGIPELLDSAEDNLALYDFQVFPPEQHHLTFHSFYSGTFILATLQGSVNITSTGEYCTEIPSNLSTDFAYCAINKFNFAMRATGELNDAEKRQNQ